MSKKAYIIGGIITALSAVGFFAYRKIKSFLDNFDFEFNGKSGLKIKGISGVSGLNFLLGFTLINPSSLQIKVKKYLASLYIWDGTQWVFSGKVNTPIDFIIKKGKTSIEVPFTLKLLSLPFARIPDLLNGKPVKYKLENTFKAMGFSFKEDFEGEISIPSTVTSIMQSLNLIKGIGGAPKEIAYSKTYADAPNWMLN